LFTTFLVTLGAINMFPSEIQGHFSSLRNLCLFLVSFLQPWRESPVHSLGFGAFVPTVAHN